MSEAMERGVWVDIVWHILEIPSELSEATARKLTEQIVDAVMEQTRADREHITELEAEKVLAVTDKEVLEVAARALKRAYTAESLLADVQDSGVVLDDPRLAYVTVQIDRPTWDSVRVSHIGPVEAEDGEDPDVELVTITHWRVVRNTNGGIVFSTSSREDRPGRRAEVTARQWASDHPHDYHLEVWEQTYAATPDVWRRVS